MATISKEAIQWMQDELETKDAIIDSLEDDLSDSMEENVSLRAENADQAAHIRGLEAQIAQMMSDRSMAV